MLKAVLHEGVIVPIDPLPPEWLEGTELEIEKTNVPPIDIDAWAKSMNQLCANSSIEDEETMRQAIEKHRLQAKARMNREMGLSA